MWENLWWWWWWWWCVCVCVRVCVCVCVCVRAWSCSNRVQLSVYWLEKTVRHDDVQGESFVSQNQFLCVIHAHVCNWKHCFMTWQVLLLQSLESECRCHSGTTGNAALACMTVCAGMGKRLHTLPSHPTLGETSGFQQRNANNKKQQFLWITVRLFFLVGTYFLCTSGGQNWVLS